MHGNDPFRRKTGNRRYGVIPSDTLIRLSDFDENLFNRHPNLDLAIEIERPGLLATNTQQKL